MSFFLNMYEVLGVDSKADKAKIQEAYHAKCTAARKSRIWDKTGEAQKEINRLDAAYRILYVDTTRADYDKFFKKMTWVLRLNKVRKIFYIPTTSETAVVFLLLVAGVRFFQFV